MRILVIGDTHGRTSSVIRVLSQLQFDYMFFTGDFFTDALKIAGKLGLDFKGVRGNCDARTGPDEQIIEMGGKRFLLVHGHRYEVKKGYNLLWKRGQEAGADAVVFGHTHIAHCEEVESIWLINPGSPSFPRSSSASYAVIEINKDQIYPNVIKFEKN